ncbi:molybdenum cofactor biosynthesis protein B [Lentibacillus sp. N15]|uniref:MogA/MoaB family molybdenum cofactor biosynthesis protein n=1 Tax=Lentibacillus songyuanensis TaxID=3136161 RepID=UPI0031BB8DF5
MVHHVEQQSLNCMVITISDSRTKETDKSGKLMTALLDQAGHHVACAEIVKDDPTAIRAMTTKGVQDTAIDIILTNGGTGISHRDVTIETMKEMLHKEMTGFGEIFRMLSYQEDIGSAAILSRAVAGVIDDTAVFSTPGSTGAVKLAMNKLILPELSHVVHELHKDRN